MKEEWKEVNRNDLHIFLTLVESGRTMYNIIPVNSKSTVTAGYFSPLAICKLKGYKVNMFKPQEPCTARDLALRLANGELVSKKEISKSYCPLIVKHLKDIKSNINIVIKQFKEGTWEV